MKKLQQMEDTILQHTKLLASLKAELMQNSLTKTQTLTENSPFGILLKSEMFLPDFDSWQAQKFCSNVVKYYYGGNATQAVPGSYAYYAEAGTKSYAQCPTF